MRSEEREFVWSSDFSNRFVNEYLQEVLIGVVRPAVPLSVFRVQIIGEDRRFSVYLGEDFQVPVSEITIGRFVNLDCVDFSFICCLYS